MSYVFRRYVCALYRGLASPANHPRRPVRTRRNVLFDPLPYNTAVATRVRHQWGDSSPLLLPCIRFRDLAVHTIIAATVRHLLFILDCSRVLTEPCDMLHTSSPPLQRLNRITVPAMPTDGSTSGSISVPLTAYGLRLRPNRTPYFRGTHGFCTPTPHMHRGASPQSLPL